MTNYPENGIDQAPLLEKEVFSNGRVEVSDTSYGKIRYEEALVVDDCLQKRNQKGG